MESSYNPSANRIRLLKFITVFAIGGTERQVVNLVRELDRSKFDLQMACFRRWGQFLQDVVSLGIPIWQYEIKKLYHPRTFVQQARLARFLRQQRIQVLHTYGFYAAAFAVPAAKLAGVPAIVASIRDTGETLTQPQKKLQRLAYLLADSVLVNAEAVRQWLIREGCPAKKIEVIRNGVAFDRLEAGSGRIRQELGFRASTPLVAMLSRLNRLKGVEYFLKAAASVAARFPDAHFLIVGDTPPQDVDYKKQLEQEAVRLGLRGRVTFTGFRTDVPEVLGELTLSVLPSLSEGLSNVLLESMAAGVPVVATMVGGNSEIVDDGVTGILVPPRDSDALARAMSLLLENPALAKRFGEAGRRRIRREFSARGMVERTEQHYMKLLAGSPPTELSLEKSA
jgi:L-malate glycosyltransferase